jgi:hypothetical protein
MMEFKIESGVPFASNRGGRGRKPTAFPLHEMLVGNSFLIPCDTTDKKAVDSWRRKLLVAKKRMDGGKWSTATVKDGIRVWRTE